MRTITFTLSLMAAGLTAYGQTATPQSAWSRLGEIPAADRLVVFDTDAIGKKLPVLWGFDTAWNDYANMLRGVRHSDGTP